VKIDTRNGLLATAETPEEFVKEVTFLEAPPDIDGWTPGPTLKVGPPPSATSAITATPTRAPTLPPRVVTAAPGSTPPVGGIVITPVRPGATNGPGAPVPGAPAPGAPALTPGPILTPTPTPFVTVTQPPTPPAGIRPPGQLSPTLPPAGR
jgi:hypothetical protein